MKFMIFVLLFTHSGLAFSDTCIEMSKRFFLDEMDAIIGENAPPVKQRPALIAKLLSQIKAEYPNEDPVKCMSAGLDKAQSEKNNQPEKI